MTSANPTAFKTAREVISSGRHRERSDPSRGNDWRREYHPYKSRNVKGNKDILEMFGVKRKLKQSEQNSREDGYEVIDCDSPKTNSDNIRSEPVHSTRNYLGPANRVKNSSLNSNGTGQSNDYRVKSAGPSLSSSSSSSKEEKPSAAQPFRPPFKKPADSTSSKPGKKYGDKDKDEEFKNLVNVDEVKEIMEDTRAKNLDCGVVDRILNEIVDKSQSVRWDDISGLDIAKSNIREIVILPMIKPHLFTGLLTPTKGMLLFGPPGTGKTLIGKCIASQSNSTFFSISASSLTSKWIGEGEKLVRALFTIARIKAPSVVFIDEIDSLLTQRNDTEHESSRRMKTEFLVQFDGLNTQAEERLLVVGATNRPHELDEAARRRFTKRLYIPLPDEKARRDLLEKLLSTERHTLTQEDFDKLCERTKGYSGADISGLCKEAALGPIRRVDLVNDTENKYTTKESLPPIEFGDFEAALDSVKSSVAEKDLEIYIDWNEKYGHFQKRS